MMKERMTRKKIPMLLAALAAVFIMSSCVFAAAPARVRGVKVSAGETGAKVRWNMVRGCDGYFVYLLDVAKNKTYTMKIPSPTTTMRKIKAGNLRRLSEYKVQVAAYKGKTIGRRSSVVRFNTIIIPPSAVKIKLRSELKKEVNFAWTKSTPCQYYELWRRIPEIEKKARLINGKVKSRVVKVSHLKAGVTYIFYVRGVREYKGKKYYGPFDRVTLTPYIPEQEIKLANTINTTYAYYGGTNPTRKYSKAQLEAYVNANNNGVPYASANKYLVWCNTNNFHVYIFEKGLRPAGRWTLIYSTPCIIGRGSHNTPRGFFNFSGRSYWHDYGGNHAEYLSYFTGVGTNAVHSLLYPTQSDNLGAGYKASGGCVRVPRRYAKFIYDNCQGSTFIVR